MDLRHDWDVDVIPRSSFFRLGARIALVLIAAWSLGGCALAISGPAPNRPPLEAPKCDTGKGPVVIDGLWATVFGIAALASFGADQPEVGLLTLGLGVAFVASATTGHSAATACQAEFVAYSDEVALPRPLVAEDEGSQRAIGMPARVPVAPQPARPAPVVTSVPGPPATGAATDEAALAPLETPTAPTKPIPTPAQAAVRTLSPRKPAPASAPASATPPAAEPDDDWTQFWQVVP